MNLGVKRYNAAKPLRSSNGAEERPGNQPYDFLAFPSVQYSSVPSQPSKIRNMDDLNSGEVSEMAGDGMVLWYVPDIKEEEDLSTQSDLVGSPVGTPGIVIRDEMTGPEQAENMSNAEVVETMLTR